MSAIDKIYNYFDREPDLKVLFIFNDEFLADELREVQWKEGYRFVDFQGDWFTVKYNLDNAWADDRVVLYFHQYLFHPHSHKVQTYMFHSLD